MNEYIILRFPQTSSRQIHTAHQTKTIRFFYWHNHRWHHESDSLVWSPSVDENIKNVLSHWINLLHEEQCLPINMAVQSVLLSEDTSAYISFTTSPFNPHAPTIDHLLFIKGILRTLQENAIPITSIVFLHNHALLQHPQLDFSKAWPLHCLNHI